MCFCLSCKTEQESVFPVRENITESVYASGVVKSRNQYQVYSTVSGLLQKILVSEGDTVKKGTPLFVISGESARLNTENARLAAEYNEYTANNDRLNEAKVSIESAKTKMLSDSLLYIRQKELWSQQIGSRIEYEQKELAYRNSKNVFLSAQYRYNDLKKQLKFASQQAKKQLSISKAASGDHIVRSLGEGRVYSILRQAGEMISPQTPVAIIGDASAFILELQVDEYDIVRVHKGQKILVGMDSYKGEVFEATVSGIDPIMNEKSRTFEVEALFTKKPPVLYPNFTAEANIILDERKGVLTIPRTYLTEDSFVVVGKNQKKKIQTGLKDYSKVEVRAGLTTEDRIFKPTE